MTEAKRTQVDVAGLNTPGLYRFAPGLFLQVKGPGAKSWIYRFMLNGKTRFMGLGSARDVTLGQARKRVDELRVTKVANKVDPLAEQEAAAAEQDAAAKKSIPFRQHAENYIEANRGAWKNAKSAKQWRSSLETYAYPIIGAVPAPEVTQSQIAEVLRPIWAAKHDTARKVRGRIEAVLDYAAEDDDYRNPATKTAQLLKKLPKLGKRKRRHHPALPYVELPEFMALLAGRDGVAARALEFTILTAARTGETTGARWSEIDWLRNTWTVPPERMKAGQPHRVPLSPPAIRVLRRVQAISKGTLIFPSLPQDQELSENGMLAVLHRMKRNDITVHGFRSTFRTWTSEQTNFPWEVGEAALAHTLEDETEAAYQRGDLFDKRRKLMDAWASFVTGNKTNVVALRA